MPSTSRRQLLSQSMLMMSAVAASGQLLANEDTVPTAVDSQLSPIPDDQLVHLLNRISFGVRDEDLALANYLGFRRYIEQQLNYQLLDASEVENTIIVNLATLNASATELINAARTGDIGQAEAAIQLQVATLARQAFSQRQLYERVVEFWSDHFSVSIQDGPIRFFKTIDDREVIRPHALGKFRDLLHASARSNAMLYYLDNFNNTRSGPNENYARELMELHTLGVDGGFTEQDVLEVARSFTGWTFDPRNDYQFRFLPFSHDFREKVVLDNVIPAGGGEQDGNTVLDLLAAHPSTARFISRKLAIRFVSENPPEELVDEIADTFMATDGDITEVMRTLLFSSVFAEQASAKLKRPVDYFSSLLRALRLGPDENIFRFLLTQTSTLGQAPFTWPAPNGFPDQSGFWANTNAMITRWNSANVLISQLNNNQVSALINGGRTPNEVLSALETNFLRQTLPKPEQEQVIEFAIGEQPADLRLSVATAIQVGKTMLIALAASRYFQSR